jgi:hypothetical protein
MGVESTLWWISNGDGLVLLSVHVAFLGLVLLWRRLVDDDMSDAGDGPAATEDPHVTVLPDIHEPDV